MDTELIGPWTRTGSRVAYENAWIRVREDSVVRPDGGEGIYGVVEIHDSVFVVAISPAREIYLLRMFRYTTESESIEVPAGGAGGEDPLSAARRELAEETGLHARSWSRAGT